MYNSIHLISALIRQFLLPNPYHFFSNDAYSDLFNMFIGGAIFWKLSYWLTGAGYKKSVKDRNSKNILVTNFMIYVIIKSNRTTMFS